MPCHARALLGLVTGPLEASSSVGAKAELPVPLAQLTYSNAGPGPMSQEQPKNKLHGITLERIVTELVEHYGWPELGQLVDIRCFQVDPSIGSSLKFLRRTPWARAKVESLYQFMLREQARALRNR